MASAGVSKSDMVKAYIEKQGKKMDGPLMDEFKTEIENNEDELRKRLTSNSTLDAHLLSASFFDHLDRKDARRHGAREKSGKDKAIDFVNVLIGEKNKNCYALWKVFKDMKKDHVANLFEMNGEPPTNNDEDVSEDYEKHIRSSQRKLQKLLPLDSGDFWAKCRQEKVFTDEQMDVEIKGTHKRTQNDDILGYLLDGTNQKFVDFVIAVEKVGQPFIFTQYMMPEPIAKMDEDEVDTTPKLPEVPSDKSGVSSVKTDDLEKRLGQLKDRSC